MDPLCISLVQQYLDSTNSALADQFRVKYQPHQTNMELKGVLSKWNEEQLARGLIYQHLKTVTPSLAAEFWNKHSFSLEATHKHLIVDIQKKVVAIASVRRDSKVEDESGAEQNDEWKKSTLTTEEQLVRCLIHEHLKMVAPSLAVEFRGNYSQETVPKHLVGELQKKVFAIANTTGINKVEDECVRQQDQGNSRSRIGVKVKTYSKDELARIQKAMANEENLRTVAKEMGRTYHSVFDKIRDLRRFAGLKKGKFSAEEIERVKQAVANNEDYKSVAAELGRSSKYLHHKMFLIKGNPGTQCKGKGFSFEEDLRILDKIIPHLEFQKLSSAGFLSQSQWMELAKELQRNSDSLRTRWERNLQSWLLQYYAGTTGFRVERMLTSLVAKKFNDHRGIDWSEILNQHKEFVGHTAASIRQIYHKVYHSTLANAKKGQKEMNLQEVADYAAKVYQPGMERKESAAKIVHREKIILYFEKRVAELGINVGI